MLSVKTIFLLVTVLAAVVIMGDSFGYVNAVGLTIVIFGVILFNMYKLQKLKKVYMVGPRLHILSSVLLFLVSVFSSFTCIHHSG